MATDWGVHNSITSQMNPGGASVSSKLELIVVFRVNDQNLLILSH